jgi:NAD(P)-dependent dehydrogenase (short-subunit alcohol dehydrogenase family)
MPVRTNVVTLVTGAGGALGGALLRTLAPTSRALVAVGRGLSAAALSAQAGDTEVLSEAFDLTDASAWSALTGRLATSGHTPTRAVFAAGAYRGGSKLHEQANDDDWEAMLSANLTTARAGLRALLPGMLSAGGGSIVLVASRSGIRPWEAARSAAYAASKAALVAMAQAVAREVLDGGVRINVILPATIDTPNNRAAMPNADTSRWVAPESIGGVVAFLLSDAARDVSGALIPVYGRDGV